MDQMFRKELLKGRITFPEVGLLQEQDIRAYEEPFKGGNFFPSPDDRGGVFAIEGEASCIPGGKC